MVGPVTDDVCAHRFASGSVECDRNTLHSRRDHVSRQRGGSGLGRNGPGSGEQRIDGELRTDRRPQLHHGYCQQHSGGEQGRSGDCLGSSDGDHLSDGSEWDRTECDRGGVGGGIDELQSTDWNGFECGNTTVAGDLLSDGHEELQFSNGEQHPGGEQGGGGGDRDLRHAEL